MFDLIAEQNKHVFDSIRKAGLNPELVEEAKRLQGMGHWERDIADIMISQNLPRDKAEILLERMHDEADNYEEPAMKLGDGLPNMDTREDSWFDKFLH